MRNGSFVRAKPMGRRTREVNARGRGVRPLPLHLQCHPQRAERLPTHPNCNGVRMPQYGILAWIKQSGMTWRAVLGLLDGDEGCAYKVLDGRGRVRGWTDQAELGLAVVRYLNHVQEQEWELVQCS